MPLPGGTSATSPSDQYTYIPAPTVSALTPSSCRAAGGTSVKITGTNLSNAVAVSAVTSAVVSGDFIGKGQHRLQAH